jgi:hypothetical protein
VSIRPPVPVPVPLPIRSPVVPYVPVERLPAVFASYVLLEFVRVVRLWSLSWHPVPAVSAPTPMVAAAAIAAQFLHMRMLAPSDVALGESVKSYRFADVRGNALPPPPVGRSACKCFAASGLIRSVDPKSH